MAVHRKSPSKAIWRNWDSLPGNKARKIIANNTDAIAILGFSTLMALFALTLAPDEPVVSSSEATWDIFNFAEPDEIVFEPTKKEVELDLPFGQYDEAEGQALEETAAGTLPPGWLSYTIKRNDTLGEILTKISEDEDARRYLVSQNMSSYRKLRSGKDIQYKADELGNLVALVYKASPELHLRYEKDAAGNMKVSEGTPTLQATTIVRSAEITPDLNSLFAASDDAKVPDAIIQQVIDALETRIDFVRDTRLSDNFTLVYEVLYDEDGDYAGPGELLGMHYVNKDNSHMGLYNPTDGHYYTPNGESLRRAFLRSPLKFSRISSRYSLRRFHPVLKKWRAHRGVDFAAPTNTPVRSTADGTVEFIGKKGGYGNLVMVRHFDKYLTVYGHLNKFAKGLKRGSEVEHGQVIGYVGSTGLATGPHLHYEFRIDGKHVDPLSVDVPTTRPPLQGEELASFQQNTNKVLGLLDLGEAQGGA